MAALWGVKFMRRALGNLSAAYMVAAGIFGGAMLLNPGAGSADETDTDPGLGWYDRFEMRVNPPPDSINIPIGPFYAPLRRLDDNAEEPNATPSEPDEIAPEKPSTPLITRFADIEILAPVLKLPPEPKAIPLDDLPPEFGSQFASLEHLGPVRIAPEPGKVSPITQIAERLHAKMPPDLYANFDLFLYVSKSTKGPLAQRMYVFAKNRSKQNPDELTLLYHWPVSTGREGMEVDNRGVLTSTATPVGYYQLDPKRFFRKYTSSQWGKPMPNSMFFDWMVRGYQTGLAIHGVSDKHELEALGERASGGCVHLSPESSAALFSLIQREYKGAVPRFAYNRQTKTVSNTGALSRDRRGDLRMANGYKALVVIENYGGEDLLSELDMDLPGTEG